MTRPVALLGAVLLNTVLWAAVAALLVFIGVPLAPAMVFACIIHVPTPVFGVSRR